MEEFQKQLLASIHPDMKLNKAFFLKIYADSIYCPEFKDIAIQALEEAGCKKARSHYDMVIAEYQKKRDEELKPIAKEIQKRWDEDWKKLQKGSEEQRKQKQIQLLTLKKELFLKQLKK